MMSSRQTLGRRTALSYGLAAIAGVLAARDAAATSAEARDWLSKLAPKFADGSAQQGKLSIKAPEIAENGNAVPVTLAVDSEMSEKSWVKALYLAADGNPNPGVVSFAFTPLSGKAEVQLRVRLAQTQKLIAVAEMNDGSLLTASHEVKVTIGGCGG
jgi:sulfur-oxidizing protein SoxY